MTFFLEIVFCVSAGMSVGALAYSTSPFLAGLLGFAVAYLLARIWEAIQGDNHA